MLGGRHAVRVDNAHGEIETVSPGRQYVVEAARAVRELEALDLAYGVGAVGRQLVARPQVLDRQGSVAILRDLVVRQVASVFRRVRALSANDDIVAVAAPNGIVAMAPMDEIPAPPAVDGVVAGGMSR
jgi:hypothetical protein